MKLRNAANNVEEISKNAIWGTYYCVEIVVIGSAEVHYKSS